MKIKSGLVKQVREEKERIEEENNKKEAMLQTDTSVIIKRKSSNFKLRFLIYSLKFIKSVTLLALAFIGLVCVCYPETRQALMNILNNL